MKVLLPIYLTAKRGLFWKIYVPFPIISFEVLQMEKNISIPICTTVKVWNLQRDVDVWYLSLHMSSKKMQEYR